MKKPDSELFRAWKSGSVQAFQVLYGRYFRKLVWFCSGFGLEKEVAEDLIQDFFLRWLEKPDQYRESAGAISTWLYTCLANRSRNVFRQAESRRKTLASQVIPFVSETAEGSDAQYEREETREEIRQILESLSGKERSLYLLRFQEEKTVPEIARILDLPEGSVKSGLFYLIQKVGKALKKNAYERES